MVRRAGSVAQPCASRCCAISVQSYWFTRVFMSTAPIVVRIALAVRAAIAPCLSGAVSVPALLSRDLSARALRPLRRNRLAWADGSLRPQRRKWTGMNRAAGRHVTRDGGGEAQHGRCRGDDHRLNAAGAKQD